MTAVASYQLLATVQGDYLVHIAHWKALHIIKVDVIEKGESCKSGWETPIWSPSDRTALQTIGRFPGSLPWCECGPDGFVYTYLKYQYKCDCGPTGSKENGGTTYVSTKWGTGYCSANALAAGCSDQTLDVQVAV